MMASVIRLCTIFLLFTVCAAYVSDYPGSYSAGPVSEKCLSCLCQAASGCQQDLQCEGDYCGMFRISWAYWADAGKPTINGQSSDGPDAYVSCTNNPYCAALTVQGYMKKFAQDCNGDQEIDCYDYNAIHKLGGYGCTANLPYRYANVFNQCFDARNGNGADSFQRI